MPNSKKTGNLKRKANSKRKTNSKRKDNSIMTEGTERMKKAKATTTADVISLSQSDANLSSPINSDLPASADAVMRTPADFTLLGSDEAALISSSADTASTIPTDSAVPVSAIPIMPASSGLPAPGSDATTSANATDFSLHTSTTHIVPAFPLDSMSAFANSPISGLSDTDPPPPYTPRRPAIINGPIREHPCPFPTCRHILRERALEQAGKDFYVAGMKIIREAYEEKVKEIKQRHKHEAMAVATQQLQPYLDDPRVQQLLKTYENDLDVTSTRVIEEETRKIFSTLPGL